jgi:hypothetical protein
MTTTERDPVLDELELLRRANADLWDEAGEVRLQVMQAIYDAGVHTEVCDDDPVPYMVRTALAAVARREALVRPETPAEPAGYSASGIGPEGVESGPEGPGGAVWRHLPPPSDPA